MRVVVVFCSTVYEFENYVRFLRWSGCRLFFGDPVNS